MSTLRSCRRLLLGVCLTAVFLSVQAAPLPAAEVTEAAMAAENTDAAIAFRNEMRKLWEDHIIFTRNVIISVAADLPDLDPVMARLMQNQVELGNAVKPFYGDEAGEALTALLREHISGAGDVLMAAKAGDAAALATAQAAWYANGDEIAAFLSAANPDNWPLDPVKALMKMHLDTTTEEAVARLEGDWARDLAAFEEVHRHILVMADALSLGIIRQFPEQFGDQAASPLTRVTIGDNTFEPRVLMVAAGTVIRWTNEGQRTHTVTGDTPGGPASGAIAPGGSYEWQVPADAAMGTHYYYHCEPHGAAGDGHALGAGMSGSIMVH